MKRKSRPSSRGSVFIETGIALAFLLMMIGGIILIATQLNRYSKVTESLSQAARLGSTVAGLSEDGLEVSCSSNEISSAVQAICLRAQRLLTENGIFPATEEGAASALGALSISHSALRDENDRVITNRSVVRVRAQVPLFSIGSVPIGGINVLGASPYLVNESQIESGGGSGSSGSTGLSGSTGGGFSGLAGSTGSSGSSGTKGGGGTKGGITGGSAGVSFVGDSVDDSSDDTIGTGIRATPYAGPPATDSTDSVDGDDDSGGLPGGVTPIAIGTIGGGTGVPADDEDAPDPPSTPIMSTAVPTAIPATAVPPTAVPATAIPATAVPTSALPISTSVAGGGGPSGGGGGPVLGGGGGGPVLSTAVPATATP